MVSSHLLDELEKVATHYGIVRGGKMVREMTAAQLEADCPTYTALRARELGRAKALLGCRYHRVEEDPQGNIRVYDDVPPEEIVCYLYENGICVSEIRTAKIRLEEYYTNLMKEGR